VGITAISSVVSYRPLIRYTLLPSLAAKIPCHLASIWSFAWLTDLLCCSDSGSTIPVETTALTSVIAPSFPVTMTSTNRPLAPLRASAHEGDTTSTKLLDLASSLRQWPQANLTYINLLIGDPAVWLFGRSLPPKLTASR
jgi:hypothetical protein